MLLRGHSLSHGAMNSITEEEKQQKIDRSPNDVKVLNFTGFSHSPLQSERNLYLHAFLRHKFLEIKRR